MSIALFAAAFAAMLAAHHIADFWIQTSGQARLKGAEGWTGRRACAAHVAGHLAASSAFLAATLAVTDASVHPRLVALALAITAITHYCADRRRPLQRLAELVSKGELWHLGAPRRGRDDNPTLGTGAFHLDQAWHLGWLWVAALIIAA